MDDVKLQQISDIAWIVNSGKKHMGLLNRDAQSRFTYISGQELLSFQNEQEVEKHFGNVELFTELDDRETVVIEDHYVKGFRIDYPDPYVIDETHPEYHSKLPLYTKVPGGNVIYAGGYYCIRFDQGWKQSHEPKLSTLKKYGFQGPFHTMLEARQRMKYLNKNES